MLLARAVLYNPNGALLVRRLVGSLCFLVFNDVSCFILREKACLACMKCPPVRKNRFTRLTRSFIVDNQRETIAASSCWFAIRRAVAEAAVIIVSVSLTHTIEDLFVLVDERPVKVIVESTDHPLRASLRISCGLLCIQAHD